MDKFWDGFIGATLEDVREMTRHECLEFLWDRGAEVMVFSNGKKIVASRDPEGNGPGFVLEV